jgi:hypothetical protein
VPVVNPERELTALVRATLQRLREPLCGAWQRRRRRMKSKSQNQKMRVGRYLRVSTADQKQHLQADDT